MNLSASEVMDPVAATCKSDEYSWFYRSEGNASLVIYNPETRTVLKLRKTNPHKPSPKASQEDLKLRQDYIQIVVLPLLGAEIVTVPRMVDVTTDFLKSVAQRVEPLRPTKRLESQVDVDQDSVFSFPDSCCLQSQGKAFAHRPTFAVEIKPKRGFLPSSCLISSDLAIKRSVCHFCLLQQFKVKRGVWKKRSHYCPLDLFSCDPSRMKHCLNMLLENPQNNLKIFKDGIMIYQTQEKTAPSLAEQRQLAQHLDGHFGESCTKEDLAEKPLQSSCVQSLLDVVIRVLLSHRGLIGTVTNPRHGRHFCDGSRYSPTQREESTVNQNLEGTDDCILRRLLAAQSLSGLEIDVIQPLYQKALRHLEDHPQDRDKYPLDFPYGEDPPFSSNLSACEGVSPGLVASESDGNGKEIDVSGMTVQAAVREIHKYLITRTMFDCSIMLAIHPVTQDERQSPSHGLPHLQTSTGRIYLHTANIIDLDPKPSTRIPTYSSLDRDVTLEYATHHQNVTQE